MCKLCDKIAFIIDTIELLCPNAELYELFADSFGYEGKERDAFLLDPNIHASAHANFISIITARYGIKKQLPPTDFLLLLNWIVEMEYGRETAARVFEQQFGRRPESKHHDYRETLKKKLEDYES